MDTRKFAGIAFGGLLAILAGVRCSDKGDEITRSVNLAPEITSAANIMTTVGQRVLYRATASDPDGTTPSISFSGIPSWLAASADSVFGMTPGGASDTSFSIIASDGAVGDTLQVNITIGTVNNAPLVTSSDTVSASQSAPFVYRASASDPDGTTPSISFINYPLWMSSNADSIYGSTPSGAIDTSFQVVASDGLLADTLTVSVSIIAAISFSGQIQPVLSGNCATSGCHMGPAPAGGLRLMSYAHLMAGGVSGSPVVAFDPVNSLIIKRVEGTIQPQMPFNMPPLPDSSIQLMRGWIAQGAMDN
jgi:hypothetical protein